MGLDHIVLDFISECAESTIGHLHKKRMLELGSQEFIVEEKNNIPEKTGKQYFENRGIFHTSFDLDGMYGSLRVDLAKPIKDPQWLGYFDIVTNSGTSEHVEPYKAQYECFKNIHNCLRKGGIAVHVVPDIEDLKDHNRWKKHSNNYYSREFFRMLAINNKYKVIALKVMAGMIWICLLKQKNVPFMENRKEFLRYIVRKKGGTVYPDINSWGITKFYYLTKKLIKPLYYRFMPRRDKFKKKQQ